MELISAAIIAAGLFYLHWRRVEQVREISALVGYAKGHEVGEAENAQRQYAKGYEDGVYEGRLKERLELETRERKAQRTYEQGYEDAIADVVAMNAPTAIVGPTIRLNA